MAQGKPEPAPRHSERTRKDDAAEERPKGMPTDDRHATETAGGQHKHGQPHTTGRPATRDRKED